MRTLISKGRVSLPIALTATLALAITFTFNACGGSDDSGGSNGNTYTSTLYSSGTSSSSESSSSSSDYNSSNSSSSSGAQCESIFNTYTHFCYEGGVYSRCNGIEYNPTTHICQDYVANPARCNGVPYNPLEQGCCVSAVFSLANQRCQNSVVETKCGTNWYNANANLRCENDVVETKCGANWYNATNTNLRCESDVVETKCGTNSWYDVANTNLRCENNIVETRCGAIWYNAETLFCSNGTLFMTDSRDNQTYKVVIIGTQTWMAQNLNYKASGYRCYDNSEANCTTYGRLYSDVMIGNVCPSGWHLPTTTEWDKLLNFVNPDCFSYAAQQYCVGNCANAGTKLKATSGWNTGYNSNTGSYYIAGTDDFGFAALPGGSYPVDVGNIGTNGSWWSATRKDGGSRCDYRMGNTTDRVNIGGTGSNIFLSVRCVKN